MSSQIDWSDLTCKEVAYSNEVLLSTFRHLGNSLKGEKFLKDALRRKEKIFGERSHPEVALTLTSLANVLNEQGRHNEAMYVQIIPTWLTGNEKNYYPFIYPSQSISGLSVCLSVCLSIYSSLSPLLIHHFTVQCSAVQHNRLREGV